MLKKPTNKKNKNQGFTLVEALISITILMISVAAPLNLASQGLVAAEIAQRQIVAFYLAQDATETVINLKTQNKLNNVGIIDGAGLANCISNNGCYIDTIAPLSTGGINDCGGITDCPSGKLNIDSNGLYRTTNKAPSDPFSGYNRYTKINRITVNTGVDDEAEISTTVWWNASNGARQTHTLNTNISNW